VIHQIKTESGSTYELDLENSKIRRLSGTHEPTARQGQDGQWRSYLDITEPEVGPSLFICWSYDEASGRAESTMTSSVTAITLIEPSSAS